MTFCLFPQIMWVLRSQFPSIGQNLLLNKGIYICIFQTVRILCLQHILSIQFWHFLCFKIFFDLCWNKTKLRECNSSITFSWTPRREISRISLEKKAKVWQTRYLITWSRTSGQVQKCQSSFQDTGQSKKWDKDVA